MKTQNNHETIAKENVHDANLSQERRVAMTNNRQMEANEKKSKKLLIIKNRTEDVLEEHKHAETKIIKQQKTDKNTHAQ